MPPRSSLDVAAEAWLQRAWVNVREVASGGSKDARVWQCRLPTLTRDVVGRARALGWITDVDAREMARRASEGDALMLGARRLIRRLIGAAVSGTTPSEVEILMRCPHCRSGSHGPPVFGAADSSTMTISSSSSGAILTVAVASGSIGVDTELSGRAELVRNWPPDVLSFFDLVGEMYPGASSPAELWTALEAVAKTTGLGLVARHGDLRGALETHSLTWWRSGLGATSCVALALEVDASDLTLAALALPELD